MEPTLTKIELAIGRLILLSRYVLILFLLGLIGSLFIYAAVFARQIYEMATRIDTLAGVDALALMLSLIDAALVAGLTIIVIISNYESFVGRVLGGDNTGLAWLSRLDPGSLKVKVGSTIITISSVYLLKVLIDIDRYPKMDVVWKVMVFAALVVGSVALVWIDQVNGSPGQKDRPTSNDPPA